MNLNQKEKHSSFFSVFFQTFSFIHSISFNSFDLSFVSLFFFQNPFYVFVSSFSLMLHIIADVYNGYPIVRFVISNICSMLRPSVFVVFAMHRRYMAILHCTLNDDSRTILLELIFKSQCFFF